MFTLTAAGRTATVTVDVDSLDEAHSIIAKQYTHPALKITVVGSAEVADEDNNLVPLPVAYRRIGGIWREWQSSIGMWVKPNSFNRVVDYFPAR